MRAALIHDWLFGMRGGERCLEVLCDLFPQSEIFSIFYQPQEIAPSIRRLNPQASVLQRFPEVRRYYRHLLPFYPVAIWDLNRRLQQAHRQRPFDIVISISHCAAKNVLPPKGVAHLCYCLTPMRYIWDQYDAYFGRSRVEPLIRRVARPLRRWDVKCAANVTRFCAISEFVRRRISKLYQRDADVIYPPVRTEWIEPAAGGAEGSAFLSVSALVPYKNVDLVVETFSQRSEQLIVVGTGPEERRLKAMAGPNIRFVGWVSDDELARLYRESRALVFAAEEDFGMSPVEMQAAGRPVIAWGRGGVLETVNLDRERPTGVFFEQLERGAVSAAIDEFLKREREFTIQNCVANARNFSLERFLGSFRALVDRTLTA